MIKEGSRDKRATSMDCSTVFIVDLEQVLAQRELTKPIIIYRTQVYILIALSDKLKQQYPLLLKRIFRWALPKYQLQVNPKNTGMKNAQNKQFRSSFPYQVILLCICDHDNDE